MSIKVTMPPESSVKLETRICDWNYGDCGTDEDGWFWCRLECGALAISDAGKALPYSREELEDNDIVAIKDPDLSLELIFTKGK